MSFDDAHGFQLACLRCGALSEIEVTDERGEEVEFEQANAKGGMLTYVCAACATGREALSHLRRLAAEQLRVAEHAKETYDWIVGGHPELAENPEYKADLARIESMLEFAREQLDALMEIDENDLDEENE